MANMEKGFKHISRKEAHEKYGICITGASSMNTFYLRPDGCVVDDSHSIRYIPRVASQQEDPYPVYVKSDKALTPEEAMEKARKDCYMFTVEDGASLEWGAEDEEDEDDEFPDCDGECLGCDRACADRIPYPEV